MKIGTSISLTLIVGVLLTGVVGTVIGQDRGMRMPWGQGGANSQPSPVQMLMWGGERMILSGSIPMMYKLLDLKDEQVKLLEEICKEAKEESAALWKDRPKDGSADMRQFYQETTKKQDALLLKCVGRVDEVLTAEQRDLAKKIREVMTQKAEEEKKFQEEYASQIKKLQETYEKKLDTILTPEQKKKLEELAKSGPRPGGRSPVQVTPAPAPAPKAAPAPSAGTEKLE
ncbi:MAG: hypothetical protein C0404_01950 [Verrucomicrobia bacterium]|nr:hypothetical protein [Verrucomicrobiota bacterium]